MSETMTDIIMAGKWEPTMQYGFTRWRVLGVVQTQLDWIPVVIRIQLDRAYEKHVLGKALATPAPQETPHE